MAYNKINHLKRIIKIQEITIEQQRIGLTNKKIYEDFIKPYYFISKRTFDKYLGIPAKRDLKKLTGKNEN